MDKRKALRYLLVAFLGLWLWILWQKESVPTRRQSRGEEKAASPSVSMSSQQKETATAKALVRVKTDVLEVTFSQQGNFINAQLLHYKDKAGQADSRQPVQLLSSLPRNLYLAESGVEGEALTFVTDKSEYTLLPGADRLLVKAYAKDKQGRKITREWLFRRGEYAIKQTTVLHNTTHVPWDGVLYNQLIRKSQKPSHFYSRSYEGAAISSHHTPYKQLKFSALLKTEVSQNIEGGWVAMQTPYFVTAWVPPVNKENYYFSEVVSDTGREEGSVFLLGYKTHPFMVSPGHTVENISTLYVGPELAESLRATAKGLDLTIDYGWFWFLAKPMFQILAFFNSLVHNWGWSIVLITVAIKCIFYPLSAKSYKSMAKMRELAPKLQMLREQHGEDKQALGRETMQLYKREGVNPMGGCLPMLVQIPFFIALYHVLLESVQLRQAPFMLWIQDLSVLDPWHILPILMAGSMFWQQKLSPPQGDPQQAKIMLLLPVVFLFVFWSFPAGLVLYWLTNNLLSIAQQWYVMKCFDKPQRNT